MPGGEVQGLAVVAGGQAVLAKMVEADREVVGDVGILRGETVGVEVGLLGFGPALLAGQEVGQGEPRSKAVGGVGEGCDGIPERAFGGRLTAGLHAGEAGKGGWVERAGLQGAPEQGVGFGRAALDEGDRAESVEGIGIVRVGGECLSVQGVGVGEVSPANKVPNFVPTRSKLAGAPLSALRVDDVIGGAHPFWITRAVGSLGERPVEPRAAAEVMAADAALLPAMIRLRDGTARPALLLWPGVADELREPAPFEWITWGDRPREWIPLRTLEIRAQGWTRREVFPLQVALPAPPPQIAGRRVPIPPRWVDPESFAALVKECKHLLKVLW